VTASGLTQPFFHVPNHRFGPRWGSNCAGYNTGFALAAGELCVFLLDYGLPDKRWLEHHVLSHSSPRLVLAPHQYRKLLPLKPSPVGELKIYDDGERHFIGPEDTLESILAQRERIASEIGEIAIFEPTTREAIEALPVAGRWDTDSKLSKTTGPLESVYMATKNESFPTANVLAVNGMDENYDRGAGPGDPDLGRRLVQSGLQSWLCREAVILVCNPRSIMPNLNILLGTPREGRWMMEEGLRYFREREGMMHAPNPFEIVELREEIAWWREACLEREAKIPKNVVSDEDYFR